MKTLLKKVIDLQEQRILNYKSFESALKDLKSTGAEKVYQLHIRRITELFSQISLEIIETSKKLEPQYKRYVDQIQKLEKRHLEIDVGLHTKEWEKVKEEKMYKRLVESEKDMIVSAETGYFPLNAEMKEDTEVVRGEKLDIIQISLRKMYTLKQEVIEDINGYFEEIKQIFQDLEN